MVSPSPASEADVREGVENLVLNCLQVAVGETILLLNENGGVDRDLVGLTEEAIKAAGGQFYSLWVDPIDIHIPEVPKVIGNAVLAADKLLMNATLNRVILLDLLQANGLQSLVRINNRNRTPERIATEHSRFHWGLVMALAKRVEEITGEARSWHITTPHGTDMAGRVALGSEVADSFFAQDAALSRTERVFPGEVYAPVGAADANGVIAFDHPGMADKELWANPMILTVENNMLTDVVWQDADARLQQKDLGVQTVWTGEQFTRLLQANEDRFGHEKTYTVDSWHGGMHPKAIKRAGQLSDTKTMHFHIGRVSDTLSAYMSDQTIVLDGEHVMFDNGELALLQEPAFQELAREWGVTI